jgi:N-acetylmuramoyl-L-alanine amidase
MAQTYVVQPGDCLSSIAKKFGFRDWKVIYDDPNNKDFKKARPNPNVIYAGDQLFIPDPKDATKKASAPVEQLNKYKVKLPKTLLRIQVKDEEEKPIASKKYELRLGDDVRKGSTDGDGIVEQPIDPEIKQAKLLVFDGDPDKGPLYVWDVHIGHLNPADFPSGARARLNNLGYFCGAAGDEIDHQKDVIDEVTSLALAGFQEANKIKRSGELDDATAKKLVEIHGKT